MIIYTLFLIVFAVFCLGQLRSLTLLMASVFSVKHKKNIFAEPTIYPRVLIQIPVYNEGWEVKNAALAAMRQNYPAEKLEVQIIDDSPLQDHSLVEYLKLEAAKLQVSFVYLYRSSRQGYKSGALNYGMQFSTHELIAIVDADFIITADFLKTCVSYFIDEKIGGLQTSWSYRNAFENSVTATQATIFQTIFALEQRPRKNLGLPGLFTGTSGIWRRKTIVEVGGWREVPFTAEDIDLNFRSYHRGYQFAYIDEDLSSCEATSDYIAFKHQQQRWSRGIWQASLHNLGNVIKAKQKTLSKIVEISTIIYNLSPLIILVMGLLTSLNITFGEKIHQVSRSLQITTIIFLFIGPTSIAILYSIAQYNKNLSLKKRWMLTGSFLLGVGLAWAMIMGITQVLKKSKREFVVTPKGENKASIDNSFKKWMNQSYIIVSLELITFLYFGLMTLLNLRNDTILVVLFAVLWIGGLYSFITSMRSILSRK